MRDLDSEHYDMVKPRFCDLRHETTKKGGVYRCLLERAEAGLQSYLRRESKRCVGFAGISLSVLYHTLSDNLSAQQNNRTPLRPKPLTDFAENVQQAAFRKLVEQSRR